MSNTCSVQQAQAELDEMLRMGNWQDKGPVQEQARYKVERKLGQGAQGSVFKCTLHPLNAQLQPGQVPERRALKFCPRQAVNSIRHNLMTEICSAWGLKAHPHVVTLYDVFLTRSYLVMSMEVADGSLHEVVDFINKRTGSRRLHQPLARYFFQQIIITIKYCHEKGIIFRDLKPANLLVMWGPNRAPNRLLLCDFGWAKIIPHLGVGMLTAAGTPMYAAPEVVKVWLQASSGAPSQAAPHGDRPNGQLGPQGDGNPFEAGQGQGGEPVPYRANCDVWSAGCILFELLFGSKPFPMHGDHPAAFDDWKKRVLSATIAWPPDVLEGDQYSGARELLSKMLCLESERLSMEQVMEQPFFLQDLPPGALSMSANANACEEQFREHNKAVFRLFETRVLASGSPEPRVS